MSLLSRRLLWVLTLGHSCSPKKETELFVQRERSKKFFAGEKRRLRWPNRGFGQREAQAADDSERVKIRYFIALRYIDFARGAVAISIRRRDLSLNFE
jgi:hypothetical protein